MKKITGIFAFFSAMCVSANAAAASYDEYSTKKIAYGPGVQTDAQNRPLGAIQAQSEFGGGALFIGDPDVKRLWLTFDEGYENGCTGRILDILNEKKAHAVFFITLDYAKRNPELVRRMIDEGHTVGNHTCTHPSLAECSPDQVREEIMGLHEYVLDNFGYEMYVMRPPMGEFSEQTIQAAKDMGYTTVLWSFAYQDWLVNDQPEAEAAFRKITERSHNGAVYLLHAVSETNTKILPRVIDYWRENGYFVCPM